MFRAIIIVGEDPDEDEAKPFRSITIETEDYDGDDVMNNPLKH